MGNPSKLQRIPRLEIFLGGPLALESIKQLVQPLHKASQSVVHHEESALLARTRATSAEAVQYTLPIVDPKQQIGSVEQRQFASLGPFLRLLIFARGMLLVSPLVITLTAVWWRILTWRCVASAPTTVMSMEANTGLKTRFPADYGDVLRFSLKAVTAMLQDKVQLIEVEFPVASLSSVCGDDEGGVEMSKSAIFVAQFTRGLPKFMPSEVKAVRVFFPDKQEAERQKGWFSEQPYVRMDYLTQPNLFAAVGLNFFQDSVKETFQDDDEMFIMAYPSFSPDEMIRIQQIHDTDPKKRPIIIINGELDRIRTSYYPAFLYPRLLELMEDFLPQFDQALYIHNFKGTRGGVLYRVYPEPWQVFCRTEDQLHLVYEQASMPSQVEVAAHILPKYCGQPR